MFKRGAQDGLDGLAARDARALGELYTTGRIGGDMSAVDGPLPGRMLAVLRLDVPGIFGALRSFSRSGAFPWEGKTFRSADAATGAGINRVRLPGLLGRQDLFPFQTRFGPSAVDGEPTLVLDYDLPQNPPWIRRVHDEIREVEPGIWLGPAMWKTAAGPQTLLWFGLDARCNTR